MANHFYPCMIARTCNDVQSADRCKGNSGPWFPRRACCGNCIPLLRRQNGMSFPVEASSGNCSPESALRLGCDFPMGPSGKLQPGICSRNGTRFPRGPKQPPAPRQNDPFPPSHAEHPRSVPGCRHNRNVPSCRRHFAATAKARAGNKCHLRGLGGRSQRHVTEAHVSYGLPNGTGTRCLRRLTKR